MSNTYRFKMFDSLIASCRKHITIHSSLHSIIIKLLGIIKESELKLGVTYGIVCMRKTYDLTNLILRFCNIHLFRREGSDYMENSLKINKYLKELYFSLDLIDVGIMLTKPKLLKTINEILYKFSYILHDIVLNIDEKKEISEEIPEEIVNINLEDDSTLLKNITNYFDNEFEESKDDIYKFIDEF